MEKKSFTHFVAEKKSVEKPEPVKTLPKNEIRIDDPEPKIPIKKRVRTRNATKPVKLVEAIPNSPDHIDTATEELNKYLNNRGINT